MTKRKPYFTCPECASAYEPINRRQKHCSPRCAAAGRIHKPSNNPMDCWSWSGATGAFGYGQIRFDGRLFLAHRLSYELAYGPIPSGRLVMHSCDNPPCCNPAHLSLGTHADNHADMRAKGRHQIRNRVVGSRHWKALLNEENVRYIRSQIAAGAVKSRLARQFNVSRGAIQDIAAKRSWTHLT